MALGLTAKLRNGKDPRRIADLLREWRRVLGRKPRFTERLNYSATGGGVNGDFFGGCVGQFTYPFHCRGIG